MRHLPGGGGFLTVDGCTVRRWEWPSFRERAPIRWDPGPHWRFGWMRAHGATHEVRPSADGRRLLTVGTDGHLRLLDLESGRLLWHAQPRACCHELADLTPDGRRVVWAGCKGMRLYELAG